MSKIIGILTVYVWLVAFIVGFIRMNGSALRKIIFGLVCMFIVMGILSIAIIMLCIFDLARENFFSTPLLSFGLSSFVISTSAFYFWNRFEKSIK